jgi:hypothetical protein
MVAERARSKFFFQRRGGITRNLVRHKRQPPRAKLRQREKTGRATALSGRAVRAIA